MAYETPLKGPLNPTGAEMDLWTAHGALHVFQAAHKRPLCPLSLHYGVRFFLAHNDTQNPAPESLHGRFCSQCGVLAIPGLTQSSRVVFKKRGKPYRRRYLVVSCLECGGKTSHDVMMPQERPLRLRTQLPAPSWLALALASDLDVSVEGGVKKKGKKKRGNNLSSLLALKKQREESEKRQSSLNLMEFMKQ